MDNLPLLKLDKGRVHVWFACSDHPFDPDLLEAYQGLMSSEEKAKCARYVRESSRLDCLVSRALVRCALSRYSPKKPSDWRFSVNKRGKPEIIRDPADPPLRFNLSHTDGLIACAIGLELDLGIDVERITEKADDEGVARRFFSPLEAESLEGLPEWIRRRLFFSYWTLKEAYIKARGKGLSIGLDKFSFYLKGAAHPHIVFDAGIDDDPANWSFRTLDFDETHKAAVAVRTFGAPAPEIVVRRALPLVHDEIVELNGGGISLFSSEQDRRQ